MDDWPIESLLRMAERNWEAMLYNWVPPTATPEERNDYLSFFKETRTQADWVTSARVFTTSSVIGEIERLQTPTLVLHPREFLWLPPAESARLASRIPNARFSLIDGVLPLGNAKQGVQAIESFLKDVSSGEVVTASAPLPRPTDLSSREIEVLRLIAAGRSNQQIADELVIS
jgi:pimeloyl-ACP methyl ester carboxylesterase